MERRAIVWLGRIGQVGCVGAMVGCSSPDGAALPALIVHGAIVWKVVLVALVVTSLFIVRLARRWFAGRRATADAASELNQVTTVLVPGLTRVRGTLRGGVVATLTQGREDVYYRGDDIWLLARDDERIAILGPVCVDHGTRMWIGRRRGVDTGDSALTAAAKGCGARVVRAVGDGDEVVIWGELAQDDEGGWTLSAPKDREASLIAVSPRAKPMPAGIAAIVSTTVALATMWFGVLHHAGTMAAERFRRSRVESEVRIEPWGALAIAAALPGSRTEALESMEYGLETAFGHTGENLALLVAAERFLDDCPFGVVLRAVRLDDALQIANECGTRRDVAVTLAFLGRFEEAATYLPDDHSYLATTIAIATGRWRSAALGAEAEAQEDGVKHARAVRYRCIGALFRTYAGEAGAFSRVADKKDAIDCAVLEALTLPAAQQVAALKAISFTRDDYDEWTRAKELAFAAGGPEGNDFDDVELDAILQGDRLESLWLGSPAVAHDPDDNPTRARSKRALAGLALQRGDLAAARDELSKILVDERTTNDTDALALAIALRDPDHDVPNVAYEHPALSEIARLRRGQTIDPLKLIGVFPETCKARFAASIAAAQAGDGAELAATFRACHVSWIEFPELLYGILPRVRTHREPLAAALRAYRDELTTFGLDNIPFALLKDVVIYRDLAHLVGDDDDARVWQAIFARFDRILTDRQRLIAFMFWTER